MNSENRPAAGNILSLERSVELIEYLDDAVYTGGEHGPFRGGVGGQFRHCIDYYACFLSGYPEGRVDYVRRERDRRVEVDREHAIVRLRGLVDSLRGIGRGGLGAELEVRSEELARGDEALSWSRSTVLRELHFLLSHTIHHHALVAAMLERQGVDLGDSLADFGVAPSTLSHRKEADPIAP